MTLSIGKGLEGSPLYELIEKNRKAAEKQNKQAHSPLLLPTHLSAFLEAVSQSAKQNIPTLLPPPHQDKKSAVASLQEYEVAQQQLATYRHQQLMARVQKSVADILTDSQTTQIIQELIKKQNLERVKQSVRDLVQDKLRTINDQFPQQLDDYLRDVTQKTWQAVEKKKDFLDSFFSCYLETVSLVDLYFRRLGFVMGLELPLIREEQAQYIEKLKCQLMKAGNTLVLQTAKLGSTTRLEPIKEFLEKTQLKISNNAQQVLNDFDEQWKQHIHPAKSSGSHPNQEQMLELIRQVTDFYVRSLDHYFNLTTSAINLFIENLDQQLDLLYLKLDLELEHLAQKEKLVLDFLDNQIGMIISQAEIQQRPKLSSLFGVGEGIFFDDTSLRRHGPVSKITFYAVPPSPLRLRGGNPDEGGRLYSIQLTNGQQAGPLRGYYDASGTRLNRNPQGRLTEVAANRLGTEVALDCDERITMIDVITVQAKKVLKDLIFYTNKNRKFGPSVDYIQGPVDQIETVSFGNDHYFVAIQGYVFDYSSGNENHSHLCGLKFAFNQDLTALFDRTLKERLEGALDLLEPPTEEIFQQMTDFMDRFKEIEQEETPSLVKEGALYPVTKGIGALHLHQDPREIFLLPQPHKHELRIVDTYLNQQSRQTIKINLITLAHQHQKNLKELIEQALKWEIGESGKEKLRYILVTMRL